MAKEKKKVPNLRFKGFTDDWEQRRLGEVTSHRGGTAIEKYFDENGEYKVISIGSYGLDSKYVDQNIRAKSNEVTNERVVHAGELTMVLNDKTANGTIIGRSLLIENDNEYVINQRTEIIKPKESFNAKFAYTLLNGPFRNKVKRIVQGGTQIYVNYSSVEKLTVPLPNMKEQQKIGSFFNQLDSLIALHQRKLDLLNQLKNGFLQKMFADKSKFPILRFEGFHDEWEQRKLGEISTSFSGGTPSVKNKSYYGGKIPFIRSAEIHKNKTELFITESGLKNSSAKLIKKGTLLYALYGATSGEVDVSNIDGAINQAIMAIFLQKDNVSFIKYYLEKNKDKIIAKYLQGGQGNLSASIIKSVHINLPFTEEQLKISNLIKKVESLISLQHQKLAKYQSIKKSLLQQMFM